MREKKLRIWVKEKGVIHATAICQDCEERNGYYLTARKWARTHVRKTGHTVSVDVGSIEIIATKTVERKKRKR